MEATAAAMAFTVSGLSQTKRFPVKLESEEDHLLPNKRSKVEKWSMGSSMIAFQQTSYNPLGEPSPLGLRLRKSPALLDMIQSKLSQSVVANLRVDGFGDSVRNGDVKDAGCGNLNSVRTSSVEKMKASNFPASLLRIGSWECISRYEGDLVAKCYFAKRKLVWEILDGVLKSKMEIQFSDITALKASFPENGPDNLDIVLAKQPLFYRETNPQPRKHTLWQSTSDFTGGQATIHRRHFLQVPNGMLNKHFEKLIQCDPRLNLLSQREDKTLDSPYFDPTDTVFEEQDRQKHPDHLKTDYLSAFSENFPSIMIPQRSHYENVIEEPIRRLHDLVCPHENLSPIPGWQTFGVTDPGEIEEGRNENLGSKGSVISERFSNSALQAPMSMRSFAHHIDDCITTWTSSSNPIAYDEGPRNNATLGEVTRFLLSHSQDPLAYDEQCLMSRVNSLYTLLQKDAASDVTHKDGEHSDRGEGELDDQSEAFHDTVSPLEGYEKFEKFSPSTAVSEAFHDTVSPLEGYEKFEKFSPSTAVSEAFHDTVSPLGGYEKFEKFSPSTAVFEGTSGSKQRSMSRKDLLINDLHRIASLPQLH